MIASIRIIFNNLLTLISSKNKQIFLLDKKIFSNLLKKIYVLENIYIVYSNLKKKCDLKHSMNRFF